MRDLSAGGGGIVVNDPPQAAINPSTGVATVAWDRYNGTNFFAQTAQIAANGTVGAVHTLSAGGNDATVSSLALDSSTGVATIVWDYTSGGSAIIQADQVAANGTPGSVKDLPGTADTSTTFNAEVADNAAGAATVVWDNGSDEVDTAQIAANGTVPGLADVLSAVGGGEPQVAVDQTTGVATVVWLLQSGSARMIQTSQIAANGFIGATQNVTPLGDVGSPALAVNPQNGVASVAWANESGSNSVIQASLVGASGTPGSVQTLSSPSGYADPPQTIVNANNGVTTVVWTQHNGGVAAIQAANVDSSGTAGAVQSVSATSAGPSAPQIALNSSRALATVVWQTTVGANEIIQAAQSAFGPPINSAPPTLAGTATSGQSLTATPGNWSAFYDPAYTYQWQRCNATGGSCGSIAGAINSTYVLQSADVNNTVKVVVTATNVAGNASAVSAASDVVGAPPVPPKTLLHLTFNVSPVHFRLKKYKKVRLTYSLDYAATVQLSLQRKLVGYKVKGKCLAAKPRHARKAVKRCTLYAKAKSFKFVGPSGKHSEALDKVVKGSYFRKKGTYRLTAVAVAPSSAYANSAPRTVVVRSQ